MTRLIVLFASLVAFSAHADFVQNVKDRFQERTPVDYTDWYNKGDTAFAEYQGMNFGIYQNLKAAVRKNEVSIKMQYTTGPVRPDSDKFTQMTSYLCIEIFEDFILPKEPPTKPLSWDDDTPVRKNPLHFMLAEKVENTNNDPLRKTVNGWDIKIERQVMLTSCSARKI
ncbi:hypothetical protein C3433_18130 [Citrobacter freundii]|nr:hypothetical protein C3433_18130 [Citrobacter freundii]